MPIQKLKYITQELESGSLVSTPPSLGDIINKINEIVEVVNTNEEYIKNLKHKEDMKDLFKPRPSF